MPVHGFRFYFTPLTGVLFTFPSRYLFAIGSCAVFSLGSWSTRLPTGFLVPRRTLLPVLLRSVQFKLHGSHILRLTFPDDSPTTQNTTDGLLPVRSPLLRESLLISVPGLLRWFTSPSLTPQHYFIHASRCMDLSMRVTPFGHLRLIGYVHLPAAFRSLSRPSSSRSSTGIRRGPIIAWPYLSFRFQIEKYASYSSPLYFCTACFSSFLHFFFQRSCGLKPL